MYIKNHICRKERKFAKLYSKNDNISLRPLEVEASHFGMKFISISLRRAKQMRNIMYSRALFILHKNRHTIKHKKRRHRKRRISFILKRKLRGFVNAEFLDQCSLNKKTENFGFVLFHFNGWSCIRLNDWSNIKLVELFKFVLLD